MEGEKGMEVKYYICIEQVNKTNKTESRINLCMK